MTNKEIAGKFTELADLMELHKESSFRIRTYSNAYITLRKLGSPLMEMTEAEMTALKGIGKGTAAKIKEILETGKMGKLMEYQLKTPVGIREMLQIKGLGPKKIRQLWQDMQVESVGELWYACNENRLITLKGFGTKTQTDVKKKIEYFLQSKDKFHYARLEKEGLDLYKQLKAVLGSDLISFTGALRRKMPEVNQIEFLIGLDGPAEAISKLIKVESTVEGRIIGKTMNEYPVTIYTCAPEQFGSKLFQTTGTRAFLEAFLTASGQAEFRNIKTEAEIFEKAGLPFIEPELREDDRWIAPAQANNLPKLVEETDIKSVLHAHTTSSDGLHDLEAMATYAKELGYEYLGITDHSQAAFYANGLKPDRVLAQMAEIDELNKKLAPFKIYKGIESDILYNGDLDYEEEILKKFDFIIASVHTVLKMNEEKATARLIAAIENPYTTILGHPTGRLLLAREGYPIDHKAVIDACAANKVIIELNANPHRLDLDWTWIPYALEKGVKVSINSDAHSKEGIHDIHFGVAAARKGGLTAEMCFNSLSREEFEAFLEDRKK